MVGTIQFVFKSGCKIFAFFSRVFRAIEHGRATSCDGRRLDALVLVVDNGTQGVTADGADDAAAHVVRADRPASRAHGQDADGDRGAVEAGARRATFLIRAHIYSQNAYQ